MHNFTQSGHLSEPQPGFFQLQFGSTTYKSTDNAAALGVLLFGLRPASMTFSTTTDPSTFMFIAQHAAYILHLHANGDRVTLDGERRAPLETLLRWIDDAVILAPDKTSADAARVLIIENLGPHGLTDN